MPIVDEPHDFGRIAATTAISDVYAMGGRSILALGLVGMPVNVLPLEVIGRTLLVPPDRDKHNAGARGRHAWWESDRFAALRPPA